MEILKVYKCLYCGKRDNLVCCNGMECPVYMHLTCLEKNNVVIENGKFHCAYCSYKREVSEYIELFKRKKIAEENVESFVGSKLNSCSGGRNEAEENRDRISELANNDDGGGDDCGKINMSEEDVDEVRRSVSDDDSVHVGKEKYNDGERHVDFILVSDDDDEEKEGEDSDEGNDQKCDKRVSVEEKQVETNLVSFMESDGDYGIFDWDSVPLDVYYKYREKRKSLKSKMFEEKKASIPEQQEKSEECPIKSTNMQFATLKRKRAYWTSIEEERLKEGVLKFSYKMNKNIPWRKILDSGRHVFDTSRTPTDLKDKWRTMNK